MASQKEEEWDSDEDYDDELQSTTTTSVLLGVPDGAVEEVDDLKDPLVSKIGGLPSFVKGISPTVESANCLNCSRPMELALQLWCPRENSPMDRALYVWACSRAGCQRQGGSVRAFRGLSYNAKYAKQLKRAEQKNAQPAAPDKEKSLKTQNPFSMNKAPTDANVFGTDFFAVPSASASDSAKEVVPEDSDKEDEVSELADALHDTTLDLSKWQSMPSHSPNYLATVEEVLTSSTEPKLVGGQTTGDGGDGGAGPETYENSLDTDQLFERFSRRVANEGEQCIRYELGGTPLVFQTDDVYRKLFPLSKSTSTTVTGAAFAPSSTPKRRYEASSVERCSYCGKGRVFECQLMPHLISLLKPSSRLGGVEDPKQSLEERQKEVERLIKGIKGGVKPDEVTGQEWGTCLVFACEDDCCIEKTEQGERWEARACWREEVVLVQWEL